MYCYIFIHAYLILSIFNICSVRFSKALLPVAPLGFSPGHGLRALSAGRPQCLGPAAGDDDGRLCVLNKDKSS